ncbi:hypothetical protein FB567DRAFT_595223 [Paraphoma chrysanthemicola]|uniref:Uncharacterized protein n=1 Tax=Paraphoma chrysanthemicola TaxID=798071 RepID=A0A8K0R2N8_9PLEO|nr:hypothetical protein FB567DRAFT_595223 [Paraphoma chrysanthemicola]
MPDKEETTHIPTESKDQEEKGSSGSGGLLSGIGDPIGNVLGTALRPIGAPLEKGITGPLGNAVGGSTRGVLGPLLGTEEERMEVVGGKNKDSYAGPEKIGGKEQTGSNPLGLDQSGRWGFEGDDAGKSGEEKKGGGPLGL